MTTIAHGRLTSAFLAISSGLLLASAFPEWRLWLLAWVGAAPLIVAVIRERGFWRSFGLGLLAGTTFYLITSHWVTHSMHNYGHLPIWLSYLAGLIFALALGLFNGLFAATLSLAIKRFGIWGITAAPAIWAASEWARLKLTGMGWNSLGYSQAFNPSLIQISRLGGVYVVSFALVAASCCLVFALLRQFLALALMGAFALAPLAYRIDPAPADGSMSVAAIQPNVPIPTDYYDERFFEQMKDRHLQLSYRAMDEAGGKVELVIWPESPVNFEYDRDENLRRELAEFTRKAQVHLLFNSWGAAKEGDHNSAMLIGPSGDKIAQYDKIALMPFGEYVPARRWVPFLDRVSALVADVAPGDRIVPMEVPGARLGAFICFEATRPEIARRMRLQGASALVQLTNEAWFGSTAAARQTLAHAIFRAVENNVDLIRVTNSGLSARIDNNGLVREPTPMFQTATRIWNIKSIEEARHLALTPYTRYGDAFAAACAALSLLVIAIGLIGKSRSRRDDRRTQREIRSPIGEGQPAAEVSLTRTRNELS
jgi:apolipoprotein N-acyltransferase